MRPEPPLDRISAWIWFEREHRKISLDVWKRATVSSKANCIACHRRADQGDFDDEHIRIPRQGAP